MALALATRISVVAAADADPHVAPKASDLRIAAERFDEGRQAYKLGNFAEAAEHFEAADARAPSTSAIGLAMRSRAEAGQLSRAASLAALILRRHPDDAELVEKATAIIDSAEPGSGRIVVQCDPDCDLVVDDRLMHGPASRLWTLFLDPGPHIIVANWSDDRVATEQLTTQAGETRTLSFQPKQPDPLTAIQPRPPPDLHASPIAVPLPETSVRSSRGLSPTYFWIGVGASVAAGAATIWSGIDTLNNPGPDAVRQECAGRGESCALYQQGQRNELRTNVLIGTTAFLALTTIVTGVFFTDFSYSGDPRRAGKVSQNLGPRLDRAHRWWHLRSTFETHGMTIDAEGRF